MRRRCLILGSASLLLSLGSVPVRAERPTGRLPKVGILSPSTPAYARTPGTLANSFLLGLADLGYVDGQNVSFEFRFANHELERLPALAAELVATHPDVLWTFTSGGALAVASAASTIPIVVAPVNEATMHRLVADFAHPAGNITGLTLNELRQHEKCLQLLKGAAPRVTRVGVLLNPLNPAWDHYPDVLSQAARDLAIELIRGEARGVPEIDKAFAAMAAHGIDGLFALNDSTLVSSTHVPKRIMELIDRHHLPAVSDAALFAREGGLLALGTDASAMARRGAVYVHRILQGAKPSELPVQHPAEFRLIVNLIAAKTLGLELPPALLARADEVIE
jgi:putative tryptophan/tyrosine transport system substrate-binding protein